MGGKPDLSGVADFVVKATAASGILAGQYPQDELIGAPVPPVSLKTALKDTKEALDLALMARALFKYEEVPSDVKIGSGWTLVQGEALTKLTGLSDHDMSRAFKSELARLFVKKDGRSAPQYALVFESSRVAGGKNAREAFEAGADFLEGYKQGLGFGSVYYDQAISIGKALKQSGLDVVLAGHSMGGGLATAAALATGLRAVTFCAAGVHHNTVPEPVSPLPKVQAYFVPGEFVSLLQDDWQNPRYEELKQNIRIGPLWESAINQGLLPGTFGERIELPLAPPPGTPKDKLNDPLSRHGWVVSGLEARKKELQEKIAAEVAPKR